MDVEKSSSMRTYILADNQFITGKGVRTLLKELSEEEVLIVQANTVRELQETLNMHPDAVVILDYTLFDFVSMQQMLIVKASAQQSAWILFSEELGEHFLRHILAMDPALSVVMKHDSEKEITAALQQTTRHIAYLCESAKQILRSNIPDHTTPDRLTATEKVILHEIALGKTTKEIAYEKNLSFHTVNSHRKNIFRKLEINNVHEAVKYAMRAGIIDPAEYYI